MRRRAVFRRLISAAALAGASAAGAAAAGSGAANIRYVTDTAGAEDIVPLPGGRWLIAGGLAEGKRPGTLHLVDRSGKAAVRAQGSIVFAHDRTAYPECPGPYDPARFSAHGVNVRKERGRAPTLYVVNHGREAVEAFRVTGGYGVPRLSWIGCVPLPKGSIANGVAPLPGGGIAATLMLAPEYSPVRAGGGPPPNPMSRLRGGETTGYAVQWFPGRGWSRIAGSEGSGPNGIEASPDGRWLWVAMWGSGEVIRVPRDGRGEKIAIRLPLLPDNLRWGEDGALWAAGAADRDAYFACRQSPECRADYAIARIDSRTSRFTLVPHPDGRPAFGDGTTALMIGGELWLSAYPTDRIAVVPLKR